MYEYDTNIHVWVWHEWEVSLELWFQGKETEQGPLLHMKRHCVSLERHRHCWQLLVASLYTLFHSEWNQYINFVQIYYIFYSYTLTCHYLKYTIVILKHGWGLCHHCHPWVSLRNAIIYCARLAIVILNCQLLLVRQGMDDRIMSHVAIGINVCESGVELNSNTQMEL